MKYIPNNRKKCTVCNHDILYNEEYVGLDKLGPTGDIESIYRHEFCFSLGGNSYAVSGTYAMSAAQMYYPGQILPSIGASSGAPQLYQQQPSIPTLTPITKLATPLTPYGKSLKPPLWKRILRAVFGRHGGYDAKGQTT